MEYLKIRSFQNKTKKNIIILCFKKMDIYLGEITMLRGSIDSNTYNCDNATGKWICLAKPPDWPSKNKFSKQKFVSSFERIDHLAQSFLYFPPKRKKQIFIIARKKQFSKQNISYSCAKKLNGFISDVFSRQLCFFFFLSCDKFTSCAHHTILKK